MEQVLTQEERNKCIDNYWQLLQEYLDQLLYTAFLLKKENDYDNLSMRGLVITEKEVEQAFSGLSNKNSLPEEVLVILRNQQKLIEEQEERTGEILPFFQLCQLFGLTDIERLALLLCAVLCMERKYEKIYGYLHDHVEVTDPTRGLCVTLAEFSGKHKSEEISAFLAGRGNLEYLLERGNSRKTGLSEVLCLKTQVQDYLHGTMEPGEVLKEKCQLFTWMDQEAPMDIRQEYLASLERLFDQLMEDMNDKKQEKQKKCCMIFLHGRSGIGKRFLLRHLAVKKKLRILFLDISGLLYENAGTVSRVMENLFVESVLLQADVCLTYGDLKLENEEEEQLSRQDKRKEILAFMEQYFSWFFLLSEEKEEQMRDFCGRKICMELPSLTAREKITLWKARSAEYQLDDDVDVELNGNKYILTPKGIRDVLDTAYLLAGLEGRDRICQDDISRSIKQNQQNQLGAYAALINSRFAWDDLILGEEQKHQMRMVCNQMKYRDVVGEKWGFHKKNPYGRGLSVLLYGPPGTGKTMAAQVIANELGMDLYRIDISQMVSKYIGETQKNISKLFQKAKDINAVLFFDEADSLFAKRSEAKDSHDRNANAETAHLLQKLEDYEGITVLATNYLNNIDDAFKRRMKFIINIAFPDSEVRLHLWRSVLPPEAECEEELDLEFFAENFELSGSSIKEILTNAAYLAASEHRGLINCDLIEAVKMNFAKYGKILTKDDFGYLGHK